MDSLSLANLVKRISDNTIVNSKETLRDYSDLNEYLSKLSDDPDEILSALTSLSENKATIVAETGHFVSTAALLLEFMCAVTPDLMFIFDSSNDQATHIEVLREVSRAQHAVVQVPKLAEALKDVPLTTFTIRSNNAIIILSKLEYLPSRNFDRKSSLALDYIKYRGHERRLNVLEEKVDRLMKQMNILT